MSKPVKIGLAIAAAAIILIILNGVFVVHQTQQALVVRFGNPVRQITEAGLNWKVPLIEQVEFFEKRVLDYDADPVELVGLVVDGVLVTPTLLGDDVDEHGAAE